MAGLGEFNMIQLTRTALALALIAGAGTLLAMEAQSQEMSGPEKQDGWEFQLGAGAFYVPQYEGSKKYRVQPLPWLSAKYTKGDRYVEFDGPGLRANVISGGAFEFGPVLNFDFGRQASDIDDPAVRRLGDIDSALMAGVFAKRGIDLGQGAGVDFGIEVLTDVSGVTDGTTAKFDIGYQRLLTGNLMGMAGISATWADEKYTQAYSGVTPDASLVSGLPVFTAEAGMQKAEISTGLFYQFNERWSAFGMVSYGRLLDSAAESPLVTRGGSENQGGLAFAVVRKF
ncbi:MipA/OmpV family protein [Hyphomonas sp. BRH_c22]|uniref:MipA/OmpV family protein n=1 Tax=Hyphomonas sp. BRH_c22 TaxID=1629710 RepID=UPI002630F951|nr:MipA/OmpV family protein [Hyphomonas sp. BRH_c22]